MYYNEERKERYIKMRNLEVTFIDSYLSRIFKNSKPFEVEYQKDLCDFSTPEIENMLKTISYKSVTTLLGDVNQYAIYTDWCMSQGLVGDSQNHFREIDRGSVEKYLNRAVRQSQIIEPKDILNWERLLNNASDIVALWLIFYGLTYEEILELRWRDVDRESKMIHTCQGREIVVNSHIVEQMFAASQETVIYPAVGESRSHRKPLPVDTTISDLIMKPRLGRERSVSKVQNERRIYNRIRRVFQELGETQMNPRALWKSGVVWFSKQIMKEKGMSFEEFVSSEDMVKLMQRYGRKKMSRSDYLLYFREFFDKE